VARIPTVFEPTAVEGMYSSKSMSMLLFPEYVNVSHASCSVVLIC